MDNYSPYPARGPFAVSVRTGIDESARVRASLIARPSLRYGFEDAGPTNRVQAAAIEIERDLN